MMNESQQRLGLFDKTSAAETQMRSYERSIDQAQLGVRRGKSVSDSPSQTVISAIIHTESSTPDYWKRSLEQRAGLTEDNQQNTKTVGSIYPVLSPSKLEQVLLEAEWFPYEHKQVSDKFMAFKANISGRLGIVDLDALDEDRMICTDNRKRSGTASLLAYGELGVMVDYTIIILAIDSQDVHRVKTFHPGPPIKPSTIPFHRLAKTISVREAKKLGFTIAKIVSQEPLVD